MYIICRVGVRREYYTGYSWTTELGKAIISDYKQVKAILDDLNLADPLPFIGNYLIEFSDCHSRKLGENKCLR